MRILNLNLFERRVGAAHGLRDCIRLLEMSGDIILPSLNESSVVLGIVVIDSQIVAVRSPLAGKTACSLVRSSSLGSVAEWKKPKDAVNLVEETFAEEQLLDDHL